MYGTSVINNFLGRLEKCGRLLRWLVVEWPLEQENVRFRLVDLVVFPA